LELARWQRHWQQFANLARIPIFGCSSGKCHHAPSPLPAALVCRSLAKYSPPVLFVGDARSR